MGNFFLVPVNYLAVLICGVLAIVIGFIWYGPLFGKSWMKLVGLTSEKMAAAKDSMPQTYAAMFVSSLIMAYVLFHFLWYAAPGSLTVLIAVKTAVWAWLGFIATSMLSRSLFQPGQKQLTLFYIDSGYYLVTLIGMSVVFLLFK